MKISRTMNLILPVDTTTGTAYIHAKPISREIYKEHFFILSKTFAAIFSEGLGVIAGPRVAYLMLEKIATEGGIWEGSNGVKNTLITEIIRLASLVYPVEGKGWDNKPLDVALEQGIVDLDDVMGDLVFFTCVSSINTSDQAQGMMAQVGLLWNSATTSLDITEWTRSLPTSKPSDSSGETVNTSSAKSSITVPE
ncbi:hypothetical protein [Serratia fonticola]|uniref:hypothetical protein n=1 Tax=Serratia fonticola TaxID=47917 RepID=UPI00301E2D8C